MKTVIIYLTCPDQRSTKVIIEKLLAKKLIACANCFGGVSFYSWQKKAKQDKEVFVFLKSIDKDWNKIVKIVKELHPYKIPCIGKIKVNFDKEYQNWLIKNVNPFND